MDKFMDFMEKHFFKLWLAMAIPMALLFGLFVAAAIHFILKVW